MAELAPLPADELYTSTDLSLLDFETTADLEDIVEIIGQDRAQSALEFGTEIDHEGYNLFCVGSPGTGRHTVVSQFLNRRAAGEKPADDWCYVHNFDEPFRPRALCLPNGRGAELRDAMGTLVDDLGAALPAAFETEEYQSRRQLLEKEFQDEQKAAFEAVQTEAKAKGIAMVNTPQGIAFAPMKDGEIVQPDVFEKWEEVDKERVRKEIEALQERMQEALRQAPAWQKKLREQLKDLNRVVAERVVSHNMRSVRDTFAEVPTVASWLERVERHIVKHAFDFIRMQAAVVGEDDDGPGVGVVPDGDSARLARGAEQALRRYAVNVIVGYIAEHERDEDAPVVFEDPPTLANVMGRIEQTVRYGALVTDHLLIRPGALHRANGGYLILDAGKLLMQPMVYEQLKRALFRNEVKIESPAQLLGYASTVTLEPEPIPLDVKVVLLGSPQVYYLLSSADPEFGQLFKVQAEFHARIPRTPENEKNFARLIGKVQREEGLCPLQPDAVARIIERASRLADDRERLSTRVADVFDVLREACYWARKAGADRVTAAHVQKAIDEQIHRADRVRELTHQQIERGTMLIDTEGAVVGQVNGLAVLQLGEFSFGKPSRITARVGLGRGEVIDIERRVELGGPLHAKGVLILSGFLRGRFAQDHPLSLFASLVFEQSYGGVDGDSASSTESYALLSALADAPIRQGYAVTGSVNQYGRVQAIGGVNQKIEGFFDICNSRGLTGEQGVLIPDANVKHLMLRADVVDAVRDGKFRIYAVETIDQGIEILTGIPAGEKQPDGSWPEGTINARVAARLAEYAAQARSAAGQAIAEAAAQAGDAGTTS